MDVSEGVTMKIIEAKKPILAFKEIKNDQRKKIVSYAISTLDENARVIIIQYDIVKNEFRYDILRSLDSEIISDFFYNEDSEWLYAGTIGGNVERWKIRNNTHNIQSTQNAASLYIQQNRSLKGQIALIYDRSTQIFCWDIYTRIKVINCSTMTLSRTFELKASITAALAVNDPITSAVCACVGFTNHKPPIVFDCEKKKDFIEIYNNSLDYYQRMSMEEELISTISRGSDKNKLIFCGVCSSDQDHWVSIYKLVIQKQQSMCHFQAKIRMSKSIMHIEGGQGIISVCCWNWIYFFEIESTKRISKIRKHRKWYVGWNFIIQRNEKCILFLVGKGFNYLDVGNSKKSTPKLQICSKQYQRFA